MSRKCYISSAAGYRHPHILLFMDAESITVIEPYCSSENMPSLADFIKQAEETQSSFRQFTCVKDLKDCDPVIIPALHRVIKETVSFYFIEIFSHLDLFYFSFCSRITPTSLTILYSKRSCLPSARLSTPSRSVIHTSKFPRISPESRACTLELILNW